MGGNQHILMFPFMAQGHIIPFLALARLIEQKKGYTITFISTPLNIRKLRQSLPSDSSIRFVELPFSSTDHGLPPDLENTDVLPLELFPTFFEATEKLQPSFEHLVSDIIQQEGRNRLLILADVFVGWTVETARKLGVFHSVFVTSGAYGAVFFFTLWLHQPSINAAYSESDEEEVPVPGFPELQMHRSLIWNTIVPGDGTDPLSAFLRRQISYCYQSSGLVINTVEELEKTGISMLIRSPGIPLWAIGPLLRHPSFSSSYSSIGGGESCIEWLNSHPPASVLYVSFGSQNTISSLEMMELAKGLEASGKAFIWVLRPPAEFDAHGHFRSEWLPPGFEHRITRERKQGLLLRGWAPQLEILSHRSTGAFLSHCGWNSVLESLSQGVPIIGWPLLSDQLFNSKMMEEEIGVCVEVGRGKMVKGLECGWEGVKRVVEMVMGETEKGRDMRRKAGEIKELMRRAVSEDGGLKGSSVKALDDFLNTAHRSIED